MLSWKSWPYKNLTFTLLGLILALLLSQYEPFHNFLLSLGEFEYISAFVGGALFVSFFTLPIGIIIILVLAENLPLFPLAVAAGIGGVIADYIIFRIVRDNLSDEIEQLYNDFGGRHLTHLLHTSYFHWMVPLIGAILIASPLPDELGVSLMGLSKMKTVRFLEIAFLLDVGGVLLVLWLSQFIKP